MESRKNKSPATGTKKFRPKVRKDKDEPSNIPQTQPHPQPVFYSQPPPPPPSQPGFYQQQSFVDLVQGRYGPQPPFYPPHSSQVQQHQSMYRNTQYREPRRVDVDSESEELDEEIEIEEEEEEGDEDVAEMQEDVAEEEEDEEATQPAKSGKKKRTHWSTEEEVNLAKAYIYVSEDGKVGDQQKHESFWNRILAHFNGLSGRDTGRTIHMVNTKWNNLNKAMTKFNGLHTQNTHARPSGASDKDVFDKTMRDYKRIYEKKGFTHVDAWEVVKDHKKWLSPPQKVGGLEKKRTKISASGEYTTSNEVDSAQLPSRLPDLNENSMPSHQPRRRTGSKKSGESSTKGSANALEVMERFELKWEEEKVDKKSVRHETAQRKREMYEKVGKTMDRQRESMDEDQRARDLELFLKPYEGVPETLLPVLLDEKRQVAARYGWQCNF
ncbi:hypothetical protein SSX86_001548 [Deinandra increscens subsp. villosa]|uniref:Myb-like domain-containing protein n=1 Tax=Deinandra increscens subsp. villosa TaxID=3103831 RepID=A0AAP0HEM4_9ASTR